MPARAVRTVCLVVGCAAAAGVGVGCAEEPAAFEAELHQLNENGSTEALGRSSREALTGGLAACAVDGFDG